MAVSNKQKLLALTEKEYRKLIKTLDTVDGAMAVVPSADEGISIKDTIAHRTHWIDLFFGWYEDGKAGRDVPMPAPGYKWNQLKDYNARVREASQATPWDQVRADFEAAHEKLTAFITVHDDDELYGEDRYAWTGKWTVGRYAEASGPSHYRSADKFIRQIIRSLTDSA